MRFFGIIFTAVLFLSHAAAGADKDLPVDFSADELTYDRELNLIIARGNVTFTQGKSSLRADHINYDTVDGVVIASGGFGANLKMVAQYAPRLAGLNSHNSKGNTGEMMYAAQAAGACLKDMGSIQCLPGSPPGRP